MVVPFQKKTPGLDGVLQVEGGDVSRPGVVRVLVAVAAHSVNEMGLSRFGRSLFMGLGAGEDSCFVRPHAGRAVAAGHGGLGSCMRLGCR